MFLLPLFDGGLGQCAEEAGYVVGGEFVVLRGEELLERCDVRAAGAAVERSGEGGAGR